MHLHAIKQVSVYIIINIESLRSIAMPVSIAQDQDCLCTMLEWLPVCKSSMVLFMGYSGTSP